MSAELDQALRFRSYAEELRVIAADNTSEENRRTLLTLAVRYEQLAANMDAIEQANEAIRRARRRRT